MTMEPGNKRGVVGPQTNARIFELLLRLRANYYWPAMHECTEPFFLTPGNREMAEQVWHIYRRVALRTYGLKHGRGVGQTWRWRL